MSEWSKITDAMKSFVDDVTTLDVVTLTGNIQVDLTALILKDDNDKKNDRKLNPSKLADEMLSYIKAPTDTAQLDKDYAEFVALTHYEADCDSVSFFSKNGPKDLIDAHNAAVKTAMEIRTGMIQAAASLVGKLVGMS